VIGRTVSHYRILEKLASGGMGDVYRAEDTRLGRQVALKFLPEPQVADPDALRRFLQEARVASALNHPHICVVHEIDEDAGQPFIAMELLEGRTLDQEIAGGPLALDRTLNLAVQIADGLEIAHAKGIIHRDIKPANLFVAHGDRAKILDFGVAKLKRPSGTDQTAPLRTAPQESITSPGLTLGTLSYMSPEQARGEELDGRSDLFSFGAVLYEMATGRKAFPSQGPGVTIQTLLSLEPPPPATLNPGVPSELERIIQKLLEKEPGRRYQNVSELLSDLRILQRGPESRQLAAAGETPVRSLAILPLANVGDDQETEYLADGITEELINGLSRLPRLRVMARSTVFRYKGRDIDPRAVGRELQVEVVLSGRVEQRGGAVVVTPELVDVANGWQLWGERYDRRLDSLLEIQEEITREITRSLKLTLTGVQEARLGRAPTTSPAAHQAYLNGLYYWNRWTAAGFRKAIEYFEQAIKEDPRYALGYAGLADSFSLLGLFALTAPKEAFPRAKEAALEALSIDPDLAEAHASLGTTRFFHDWDWPAAAGDFESCLEGNPGYVPGRRIYSMALSAMGRRDDSLREAHEALALDPLSLSTMLNLGWALFNARDYQGAKERCRQAIELAPEFSRARELLALALAHAGELDAAVEQARAVMAIKEPGPRRLAVCGHAFAMAGDKDAARATVTKLRDLAAHRYVPALAVAFVSAALGKADTAFGWLERAFDEQDSLLVWLRVDPRLDNLRSDPRFEDLVERVGLRLWR
jgi:serine/threonine protein kinase/tetratricopeptide (TPR) repeat protein